MSSDGKSSPFIIRSGLPEDGRLAAARLYDEAFGAKLGVAIRDRERRLRLLASTFDLSFAFCALREGELVGLAGFQDSRGSLTSGLGYRSLLSELGFLRGNWAALILSLYERAPGKGELVMDGIAVTSDARGQGIGRSLLAALAAYAENEGFTTIRLDVVDTNDRARKLYESFGFVAVGTERFEYLRWLLGFGASTTMRLAIGQDPAGKPPQGAANRAGSTGNTE